MDIPPKWSQRFLLGIGIIYALVGFIMSALLGVGLVQGPVGLAFIMLLGIFVVFLIGIYGSIRGLDTKWSNGVAVGLVLGGVVLFYQTGITFIYAPLAITCILSGVIELGSNIVNRNPDFKP